MGEVESAALTQAAERIMTRESTRYDVGYTGYYSTA